MKKFFYLYQKDIHKQVLVTGFLLIVVSCQAKNFHPGYTKDNTASIEGRWDITINLDGKKAPSWLEVHRSGIRTLVGEFVGRGGSARPISRVNFDNGNFSFSIPPQWEQEDSDLVVSGYVTGDSLSGIMKFSNGKIYNYTGVKAPPLKRKTPIWGKSIRLFNGTNLNGWHATTGNNQWILDSDFIRSPHGGANLETDKLFTDFKLHIEFRYPSGSNSGVYLRGRYEVQIEDLGGTEPEKNEFGSVYGFIAPTDRVLKPAGEWQYFDITLVGRMVTIVANGITIICNQEIPGITGGAIDSNEEEPGPILIQGDHDPIDIRNVILTPAR